MISCRGRGAGRRAWPNNAEQRQRIVRLVHAEQWAHQFLVVKLIGCGPATAVVNRLVSCNPEELPHSSTEGHRTRQQSNSVHTAKAQQPEIRPQQADNCKCLERHLMPDIDQHGPIGEQAG